MKDLYLPPLNLETDEDKERFGRKLRGELPSYNGTANYRLFVSTAVNPDFYAKGQDANEARHAAAESKHGLWRVEADRVRQGSKNHLSDSEVARRVRTRLCLTDPVGTIRKNI
jgi:hypothetical protein